MKNIKIFTVALGIFTFALSITFNLQQSEASDGQAAVISAQIDGITKKVSSNICRNEKGEITGVGNTCIIGPGDCEPNHCGSVDR